MVGELVIHVGDRKTGSTSIQKVLVDGAWRCKGVTVFYPPTFLGHNGLAQPLFSDRPERAADEAFARLAVRMNRSKRDVGVVSSELFEFVEPARLRAMLVRHLPGYEGRLRVVAYVRPHAEKLISDHGEKMKNGRFFGTPDELYRKEKPTGALEFAPRFAAWEREFGAAFTLRPLVRTELSGQDVVADFLSLLLGGRRFEITAGTHHNTSPSVETLALMRQIQLSVGRGDLDLDRLQKGLGFHFAPLFGAVNLGVGTRPALHRALAERIARDCRSDAEALDRQFFAGSPMSEALNEAVETSTPEPQSYRAEDHFPAGGVEHIGEFAQMIRRLIERDPAGFGEALRGRKGPSGPARPAPRTGLPSRLKAIARRVGRGL